MKPWAIFLVSFLGYSGSKSKIGIFVILMKKSKITIFDF
jgi:hypothetical protein